MTFACGHEVYAAHVGDSRIYWITPQSCHQVTVDDDLASREVKLGYLLYRDAVQYPNAGALVQALGMSSATNLHPTVQRLILDQDCVLLLCSDGLSDYDRVEQYWDSEIVPLFTGEKTVTEVGESLLQLANQKNGHDNSTIALVYCQVVADAEPITPLVYSDVQKRIIPTLHPDDFDDSTDTYHEEDVVTAIPTPTPASVKVTISSPESSRANVFPLIIGAICLGVLGIIGVIGWKSLIGGNSPVIQTSPSPLTSPTPTTSPSTVTSPTPTTSPSPTNP
jgi:protein phosphatase